MLNDCTTGQFLNFSNTSPTCNIRSTSNEGASGTITSTIKNSQGLTFSTRSKTVWIGTPVISYISGPSYTPNNDWATYYAQPNNEQMGVTDYFWALSPSNGNVLYDYGWTLDIAFYNSGNYQLVARAYNQCYWSEYVVAGVEVYDSQRLFFTPNPTTGETMLSIEAFSEQKISDETVDWELEIFDSAQNLKVKEVKIKGKEYKFNTTGWKEGIYIARVKYDDKILSGKLVVKK